MRTFHPLVVLLTLGGFVMAHFTFGSANVLEILGHQATSCKQGQKSNNEGFLE